MKIYRESTRSMASELSPVCKESALDWSGQPYFLDFSFLKNSLKSMIIQLFFDTDKK